jgi:hypothetical protein
MTMEDQIKKRHVWINYKEKEILYTDYTNLQGEEFVKIIKVLTEDILSMGKEDILLLLDLQGSYANKEIVNEFINAGKLTGPSVKKTAVLGITGVKKVLLNVVNKFTDVGANPFTTEEEAKEWLIS